MGLTLKFMIGPPQELLDALTQCDYDRLAQLPELTADFSLHLQPRDLQLLTDCAAALTDAPAVSFRNTLTCYLDEVDRGFFIVGHEWACIMAGVDADKAVLLTEQWYALMAETYPDEQIPPPTKAATDAVSALLALCKKAVQSDAPIIHIWCL